jgi:hypothetical protein
MKMTYRSAIAALVLGTAAMLGSGAANAAATGGFSPLKTATADAGGGLQLVYGGHGRSCYKDCHVGRHGRVFCSWQCYRPRRWW